MDRKISVRKHKRHLKDGRVVPIRRHDRTLRRHTRGIGAPEVASTVSSKIAARSIKKQLFTKELGLEAHTDREAYKTLRYRDRFFPRAVVRKLIQDAAPGLGVSRRASDQLNAELTDTGKEIARRAIIHMQNDNRTTLLARDIKAAKEEVELQRRTSPLYGKSMNIESMAAFGSPEEKETAKRIKKLYK